MTLGKFPKPETLRVGFPRVDSWSIFEFFKKLMRAKLLIKLKCYLPFLAMLTLVFKRKEEMLAAGQDL